MPVPRSKSRDCTKSFSRGQACSRAPGPVWSQPLAESRRRPALTLIEVLLTIAVLAILAGILIPQLSGDLPERLSAAAQVISADLDYARSLAVANNSSYRITYDVIQIGGNDL